jgi:hypothetical protein
MSSSIEAGGALSTQILFQAHLWLCAAYIQGGWPSWRTSRACRRDGSFRLTPPAQPVVPVLRRMSNKPTLA